MPDVPEIGTWWTVNGFIPDPTRRFDAENLRYAERYQDQIDAVTPRMAEDLAKANVRDMGLERGLDHVELYVTSVFEGRLANADVYARFLDPEIVGES